MGDKLSYEFKELAKRFRRINAENSDDGRRQLDSACAIGGKLLKRATDAGYLNFQGYSWGGEQPSARDKDHAFDEQIWASNWTLLILLKAFEFPNWPSNVLSFDEQQKAGHITAEGGFRKKDWRIHAENFAYVADDLAHRIETRQVNETNGGKPKIEALKPPGPKQRRATVNQRMAAYILENSDSMGWTCKEWALHLTCARSTVAETSVWKRLASIRDSEKAERAIDKRRKPKSSDIRRN